jgi:adenylate cyclase
MNDPTNAGPKEELLGLFDRLRERLERLEAALRADGGDQERAFRYLGRMAEAVDENVRFAREHLAAAGWQTEAGDGDGPEVRSARHEARNHLNHLSGPVQMLARCLPAERWGPEVGRLRDLLDQCLALVDGYGVSGAQTRLLARSADPAPGEGGAWVADEVGASVLVADDDPRNRENLADVLAQLGYAVTAVADGEAALREVEEGDHDLLLLDLEMPRMSGFEVLERMAAEGWLGRTPVLVVTGQRVVDAAVRCIRLGADDFLSKPVHVELLAARVRSSLEKKRLRQREFEQFFPADLAREFARHPDLRNLDGRSVEVSVLFCDVRGFSAVSEAAGPETTIRWLRAIMNRLSNVVIEHDGVLVDYAGDELFAMWGAPRERPDHAVQACAAALEMLASVGDLNREWAPVVGRATDFGIGVNSGIALVGNIGTDRKFKYGPLGNTVNLGSRIQGATKHVRTRLLISGETRARLPDGWAAGRLRRLCRVRVQNILAPVELHELSDRSGPVWEDLRHGYERALEAFEAGQLPEAARVLGELLSQHPEDGPARLLNLRVAEALMAPPSDPGAVRDFVWTLPGK